MFKKWFSTSLNERMSYYINKYNGKTFHPYKPHVITLKSKQVLKYLNKPMTIQEKQTHLDSYYTKVKEVVKKCYHQFDPTLVFLVNDEFHFVFYFNEEGDFRYNGNIMKMSSSINSFVSVEMSKLYSTEFDFYYTAQALEFEEDDEVLNYLIWRQSNGKNNNFQNFYKCMYPKSDIMGMTLEQIDNELMNSQMELTALSNIYGLLVKKMSTGEFYFSSFNLASNFSYIFSTFFERKLLYVQ